MRRSDLNLIAEARERAANGLGRQLRRDARLTQAEVASRLGVSRAAVAAWEAGTRLPRGRHALAYGRLLASLANRAARLTGTGR